MKRMRVIALLPLLLLPVVARADAIGIFATPECEGTCATVLPGGALTLFVRADVAGGPDRNMTGAEFRVVGLPAGWSASVTPAAALVLVFGNPIGDGVNAVFANAVAGPCVELFRIDIQATTPAAGVVLQVTAHATPSNPLYACPLINTDCGPCFPRMCVVGGEFAINPPNECTVAVEQPTWSVVKRLFR